MSRPIATENSNVAVDASAYLARRPARRRADRISGTVIILIFLAALGMAGRRIWAIATGPVPPSVGQMAPALVAPNLDGQRVALSDLGGKVVLLDFWATWCAPCVYAMPTLQAVHARYGPEDFVVLGVNQEPGQTEKVRRFMAERGLTFDTVVDEGPIVREWGVYTFPTSFLVDQTGEIRQAYRGPVEEDRLRRDIEALLDAQ